MKKEIRYYHNSLKKAVELINFEEVTRAINLLEKTIKKNSYIFSCGNGGSASISNHFQVDYLKGINQSTNKKSRIISLCSNVETITAIANDFGYEHVFANQLKIYSKKSDVLFCISSSGNSENIIQAIKIAKKKRLKAILLSGFDGGRASKLADINIHVPSKNYGIIEDCHQSIMHLICQKISKII
ncbi:MAG: hypothetical protein CBB97_17245 [Candidatus Endolissoclinum sp. TMED37]|nr:MAG: hypothetical protein CBB97_17245 [Candidatus Endolissoclinum sp. TMED37]|tara:strand:- start:1633 stop:2190 length:558 start_codon:yes stop_codon:yes gene_type:complete